MALKAYKNYSTAQNKEISANKGIFENLISAISKEGNLNQILRRLVPLIYVLNDYLSIWLAILTSVYISALFFPYKFQFSFNEFNSQIIYYIIPLIYQSFIIYDGIYNKRLSFWQYAEKIIKISTYATIFTIGILFFTGIINVTPRYFVVFGWFFSCCFLVTSRHLIKKFLIFCGLWSKPVVIVGIRESINFLIKTFEEEADLGYEIVGIIDENYSQNKVHHFKKHPVIGDLHNLEKAITKSGVNEVIVAIPEIQRQELLDIVYRLQPLVKNLTVIPDLQGMPLSNLEADPLFNQRVVMLRVRNNLLVYQNYILKRFFDLAFGSLIMVLSLPLMAVIAWLIKKDSPEGEVLHVGKRIGKKGQEFECYKFRTMHANSDLILEEYLKKHPDAKAEWEQFAKLKAYDPRITKIGKWLRKFSLDELPQIFNVLNGEMSLVGPRPYLPRERERMSYYTDTILNTTPGITGLWQVRGRNDIEFEGRLALDAWYVRNWSFWLDITLLIRTIKVVLARKGAY